MQFQRFAILYLIQHTPDDIISSMGTLIDAIAHITLKWNELDNTSEPIVKLRVAYSNYLEMHSLFHMRIYSTEYGKHLSATRGQIFEWRKRKYFGGVNTRNTLVYTDLNTPNSIIVRVGENLHTWEFHPDGKIHRVIHPKTTKIYTYEGNKISGATITHADGKIVTMVHGRKPDGTPNKNKLYTVGDRIIQLFNHYKSYHYNLSRQSEYILHSATSIIEGRYLTTNRMTFDLVSFNELR